MSGPAVLSSRLLHAGRIVRLSADEVRLPNGNVCTLEIIRHPGAAAIVPLDADGSVHLVRQYRYATGGWLLEVPAGKLDPGESPESCALREVEEETGLRPGRLEPLGWLWTTPGFTDERIWLYLATDLVRTRQELQPDEVLAVERVPFDEAVAMAERGDLVDAKSALALLRAAARRRQSR
ncbi:MAG TPA: NUDIX hydrolase [Candidatus Polarisedimenticolaceae bacterium]